MKRRKFVGKSSLGAILLMLHPEICFLTQNDNSPGIDQKINLIENIRLFTHRPLLEMKSFYVDKLGLTVLHEKENKITFVAGKSTITFVKINSGTAEPWYHFAFNIPENKILEAREWQLERTELVPTPKRLRDSNYPNDVRHFKNWNAHSIFFYDPAGNLLEFIARHEFKNASANTFSSRDILNVSEIAFVVDEQQEEAIKLGKKLNLNVYPKETNFWWAMGSANGLLLCIPKRIFGENTSSPKRFGIYDTEARINGYQDVEYKFENFPYKVTMRK